MLQANVVSVISDATLLVALGGAVLGVGRKMGWYQRRMVEMSKKIEGVCRDVSDLDEKRQVSEKASARYEEKLDSATEILKELKNMLMNHVMNGRKHE
jgi:hypothetical protein